LNSMPPLTIQQALLQAKQKIDALDAELLLAHILKKPREWVLVHPEARVHKVYKVKKFIKLVNQRAKGVPLAYLTGHKEFFGLDFEVNKNVLIPRPETERMVELVIEEIKRLKDQKITMLDVGTGSGCIPVAIVNHIRHNFSPYQGEREGVCLKTIAIDISKKALTVARRNARKHKVEIKFLRGDLLSPILKSCVIHHTSSLIITANLPYLTNKQFNSSPSIQHEPKLALVAGRDGLRYYRILLKQIRKLLEIKNLKLEIFLEIDPSQSPHITKLIKSLLPNAKIEIKKDLTGLDRVVRITNYAA